MEWDNVIKINSEFKEYFVVARKEYNAWDKMKVDALADIDHDTAFFPNTAIIDR